VQVRQRIDQRAVQIERYRFNLDRESQRKLSPPRTQGKDEKGYLTVSKSFVDGYAGGLSSMHPYGTGFPVIAYLWRPWRPWRSALELYGDAFASSARMAVMLAL
jgi:hypothetical protein